MVFIADDGDVVARLTVPVCVPFQEKQRGGHTG